MWYWFVKTGWLYGMLIMGIVLAVQLIVKWKDWSVLRKFGAFTVIVLVFHVWEEWVMPGGFHYFYNISSEAVLRDRYPMNELTDMITNFGGALLWFVLVQTNKYERKMSFAVMLFSFAEVVIHLLGATSSRALLLENGVYSPFYTPGLLTALVCWLPLGIAYIVYFVKTRIKKWDVIGGAAILVVLSVLLITMPESLLKSEDTPYVSEQLAEILSRTETPIGMRIVFGFLMTVFVMVFLLIAAYWEEGRKHFGHLFERACSTMLVPMLLLLAASVLMNASFTIGVLFGIAAAIGCVAVIVNSGKKANCNGYILITTATAFFIITVVLLTRNHIVTMVR